ncbi:MAG: hypothetical protein ACLQOO_09540 [Terriglobia bacterium]
MKSRFLLLLALGLPAITFSLAPGDKPPTRYTIPVPPPPDFSSLDWLIGEWAGSTAGRSPKAQIHFSVAYDLGKRFMVLREEVSFAAQAGASAAKESWMGILGPEGSDKSFFLCTYSSTGFVTRYRVVGDGQGIRLSSEGGELSPAGWVFRRFYQEVSVDTFQVTVEVAPPGKPFFVYYTARLKRAAAIQPPPASPATKPPSGAAPPTKPQAR